MSSYSSSDKSNLLGDCTISFKNLIGEEEALEKLSQEFPSLSNDKEKIDAIASSLYQCILNTDSSFLLCAIIRFIDQVRPVSYTHLTLPTSDLG